MEIKHLHRYLLLKFYILIVLLNFVPFKQTFSQSNSRVLTGVVTDKVSNESLPGAIVSAEISGKSTVTDQQGRFSLEVSPNDKITIKMMGYEYQTLAITDQKILKIALDFSTSGLAEVVVVGYGTQKKVNLTGSVASVTAEDLQGRPVTAISTALQGLMPGVTIQSFSAQPGITGGTIRVRGVGTLGNSNPFVLIDGIEGDLNILNPDDIESISVLKDAASSAIYGARGANGVILITTKKGKNTDKPSVGYSNYYGYQTPTRVPEFLSSAEYIELLSESQRNVGRPITYDQVALEKAQTGSDPDYFSNTNWPDEILKKRAGQQNHSVNINGGSNKTNYFLSYAYLNQDGLVTGNNFGANRNNIRARINTEILDRLNVDAILGFVDRNYSQTAWDTDDNSGVIYSATQISPLVPLRFTNGTWGYGGGSNNPVATATDGGYNRFRSEELTGNFSATLNILKGLNARAQYAITRENSKRELFTNKIDYRYPGTDNIVWTNTQFNNLDNRDYINRYQNFTSTLDYDKTFNKQHVVTLLAGYSQESTSNEGFQAFRQNFADPNIQVLNGGDQLIQRNSGSAYEWAIASYFGRVNYSFKDRYLLEGNFRFDGSSRFSEDNRWGFFPSISAGWIFSEESFFSGIKNIVPFGKVRLSWGQLGNQYVGSGYYPYITSIGTVGTMPIGGTQTTGFARSILANSNLSWENITMQNIGLDLQFLSGKLNVTADAFIKETNDILLRVTLPDVLGFAEPEQNAGSVENRGLELSANWRDKIGEVGYGFSANFSNIKNKVTNLGGVPPNLGDRLRQVGFPIDAFYGLEADGLAQVSEFSFDPVTGRRTPNFPVISGDASRIGPGDVKYKDLNNDGQITLADDRKVLGSAFPQYTFGFRGNLDWKGVDFSFFFQGAEKVNGYIAGPARHAFINESSNPQKIHLDRWTPENPDASYPRFTYQQQHNQRFSSYWLEDADYIRLKNVQLGYTIPQRLTSKFKLDRFRIYASADNIFTSSDYYYAYDPETPVTSGGYYPQVRTIIFGLNIGLK